MEQQNINIMRVETTTIFRQRAGYQKGKSPSKMATILTNKRKRTHRKQKRKKETMLQRVDKPFTTANEKIYVEFNL